MSTTILKYGCIMQIEVLKSRNEQSVLKSGPQNTQNIVKLTIVLMDSCPFTVHLSLIADLFSYFLLHTYIHSTCPMNASTSSQPDGLVDCARCTGCVHPTHTCRHAHSVNSSSPGHSWSVCWVRLKNVARWEGIERGTETDSHKLPR